MKAKDIQKKSDEDLKEQSAEMQESLRQFRFNVAGSQVRNVREGRNLRKDVARINTELAKRKREQATT